MFSGVRFVLIGFDSVSEAQFRSEIVNCGGVDVGQYDSSCTHVIVHDRVYDDPICVAARRDCKTLVTDLWVEDSLDIGSLVNASQILYRPVKDLKGISGAESLCICLTGYQRRERDNIMKMVDLMGAQFSKPLIAAKVTHLICYKFEGEKYDLAKKINIKLVNHRWLEDCLKEWKILPIEKYNKSTWELEVMDAEAKDSEDETEPDVGAISDMLNVTRTPQNSGRCVPPRELLKIDQNLVASKALPDKVGDKFSWNEINSSKSNNGQDIFGKNKFLSSPGKRSNSDRAAASYDTNKNDLGEVGCEIATVHAPDGDKGSNVTKVSAGVRGDIFTPNDSLFSFNTNKGDSDTRGNKRSPHLDASNKRFGNLTFSRTMKKTQDKSSTSLLSSSQGHFEENKVKGILEISALSLEQPKNIISCEVQIPTVCAETHLENGKNDTLPQKRKADALKIGSTPSKMEDKIASRGSLTRSPELEGTSMLIDEPQSNTKCDNSSLPLGGDITDKFVMKEPIDLPKVNTVNLKKKPLKRGQTTFQSNASDIFAAPDQEGTALLEFVYKEVDMGGTAKKQSAMTMDGESVVYNFVNEKTSNTSHEHAIEPKLGTKTHNRSVTSSALSVFSSEEMDEAQKPLQPEVLNSRSSSIEGQKLQNFEAQNSKMSSGALRKKMKASKNMGGKRVLTTGISSQVNANKSVDTNKNILDPKKDKDGAELKKSISNEDTEPEVSNSRSSSIEGQKLQNFEAQNSKMSSGALRKKMKASKNMGGKRVLTTGISSQVNVKKSVDTNKNILDPKKDKDGAELKKSISNEDTEMPDLDSKVDATKEDRKNEALSPNNKIMVGKQMLSAGMSSKGKVNKSPNTNKLKIDPKKDKDGAEFKKRICNEETELPSCGSKVDAEKKERDNDAQTHVSKHNDGNGATVETEMSGDAEKENKPSENGNSSVALDKLWLQKAALKPNRISSETKIASSRVVHPEPVCFILSGHRLQRKEFQQVIRGLRGRICRDSHHWSYQATHFIVPDPVRRTEKFFAAAAAGRWILKTDYLTASNVAREFLNEEPFEWYGKGLNEDGAISLEAPRKWRLLRERTGHGAFYGMRIVFYGECIAPSLDTLKRAVKAGDGTILATAPPYTRFLKSGVDFAVVSASMPRVDCWVQEFLRHEIPCVLADYLVEYVCKAGYSLERHVLYNTHSWADKSFKTLLNRSEEIVLVEDSTSLNKDGDKDDVACEVCGSRGRGDVMLICGDERGSLGCGIGTHVDCCDPPLEAVPEEDWFCSKCSRSSSSNSRRKSTPKRKRKNSSLKCK